MNLSKLTKSDLIEELQHLSAANAEWLQRCSEMEAQLAAGRRVLQSLYNNFKVEDQGCRCEMCDGLRDLFQGTGGRAMLEEFREQKMAIREALNVCSAFMAGATVSQGQMKRLVTWLARLGGR